MSISAISGSSYSDYGSTSLLQQIQQEFQQLGSDLSSGNLSAAQQDYVTLQQDLPQSSDSSSTASNPLEQAFNQLSQDLQSGNLTAAQQDFKTIQQDLQSQASQAAQGTEGSERHHHHGGKSEVSQLMNQLGQDLQSGNLTAAQQDYSSLQKIFQQYSGQQTSTSSTSSSSSDSSTSTFSVSA